MLVFVIACTRKRVSVFSCEGIHYKKSTLSARKVSSFIDTFTVLRNRDYFSPPGNYWLFRVKLAIENSQHYAARNTSCGDDCSQRDLDNVDPSRRIGLDAIDRQMSH